MAAAVVATAPRSFVGGAALCLLAGCTETTDTEWTQFNAASEAVGIEVGAPARGEPASVSLTRSAVTEAVGEGSVDAAAVPVGDILTVRVRVDEPWHAAVGRVSVRIDSGERGEDEVDLERDSAGEGFWEVALEAVGEPGETRSDTCTFRLWTNTSGV